MADGRSINVDTLIDEQKFGGFALRVLVLALLALIADGYDIQVMSFAAPSLMKAWHVPRADFAPVFSASLFGILFGAPIFGWLGDKFGRKLCIILSSVAYGLMCLACLLARDLDTLMALRFLTGMGLGGVMPNAIAVAAELSPRSTRAALASFTAVGISLGGIVPGLISASLPPGPTWRMLFLVGGLAPMAIAALVAIGLPESVGLLVQRKAPRERIARLVRSISPGLDIPPDATFTIRPAPDAGRSGFAQLFAGKLKLVTPLLWLMFAATLLSIYMLTSWMPLLFEASGLSPAKAAGANSLFQAGGVAGCIVVAMLLGRFGGRLVAAMFVLSLIAIGVAARANLGPAALGAAVTVCGFFLIGAQAALNGTAGLIYPTAARARGVGLALGVGRIGSVIGPLIAGAMVAGGVSSARDLFLLPLAPLALGAVAALVVMGRLNLKPAAGPAA